MDTISSSGAAVVARFLDGRVLKGTTHDFGPQKPIFHLSVWGDPTTKAVTIPVGALKALFFVRTYAGDPGHVEDLDVANAKGQGRKILVTFADGEILCGFTTGYSADKQGFFVIPIDPKTNNSRVYAVTSSIKKVDWADAPATTRVEA